MASKRFGANSNKVVGDGNGRANGTILNLSKNKKSKKLIYMLNIRATEKPNFLTSNIKKAFNHLWLAFIKALILQNFDLESYIRIKTNALGYAIGRMLNQLNLVSDIPPNDLNSKSDFG